MAPARPAGTRVRDRMALRLFQEGVKCLERRWRRGGRASPHVVTDDVTWWSPRAGSGRAFRPGLPPLSDERSWAAVPLESRRVDAGAGHEAARTRSAGATRTARPAARRR